MSLGGKTGRRMATALVAAYLLVLQALLGGLAAGTHAGAGVTVDAFGQVICRGASAGTNGPADPAHHTPDCCTTGCQTSAVTGLPPVALALGTPIETASYLASRPRADSAPRGLEHRPHNARAPPIA